MKYGLLSRAGRFLQERTKRRRWTIMFLCMAAAVALGTFGFLKLYGEAMTHKVRLLECQYEVHGHRPDCYEEDEEGGKVLVCGMADYVIHTHNDDCYDQNGELVCPLKEHELHTHDENCYKEERILVCGMEEGEGGMTEAAADAGKAEAGQETEAVRELSCEKKEHTHDDNCYAEDSGCGLEAHTHDDGCYETVESLSCDIEEHTHDDSCYSEGEDGESVLTCDKEEHTHDDGCYVTEEVLTCDLEEHEHDDSCSGERELICKLEAHEHDDSCYTEVAKETESADPAGETKAAKIKETEAGAKGSAGHVHTDQCYETRMVLICGAHELHTHNTDPKSDDCCYSENCFDKKGKLIEGSRPLCGLLQLEEHVHSEECFKTVELTPEEIEALNGGAALHVHTEKCYDEAGALICGYETTHLHRPECYDEDGHLICGYGSGEDAEYEKTCEGIGYAVKVTYSDSAGIPEDAKLIVRQITKENDPERYEQRQAEAKEVLENENTSIHALFDIGFYVDGEEIEPEDTVNVTIQFLDDNGLPEGTAVTIVHFAEDGNEVLGDSDVDSEGNTSFQTDSFSEFLLAKAGGEIAVTREVVPGNIADYLTSAGISVNGKPYDGSPLNPGEQFTVDLKWQLGREQLQASKTYRYELPEQIIVKDVEEEVLFDDENERKGVYSVKDGVLTVTYDNISDVNITTFKLNATWNQDGLGQDIEIKWNDELSTNVKFDNSEIAVTKELLRTVNQEDGSLVGEYQVKVKAKSGTERITLTDTLTAEQFHFAKGYYKVDGEEYDFRIKTDDSYRYGNFDIKDAVDENGNVVGKTVTFQEFSFPDKGEYIVEYGVKLDAENRFKLDADRMPASLRNTATASYVKNGNTISSTVTVEDVYRIEEKWVVKEMGDAKADTDIPWTVRVNAANSYNMSGAVIGDHILTEGVVYKKEPPITITGTDPDGVETEYIPARVELEDEMVAGLAWTRNAIDELFEPRNEWIKAVLDRAAGTTLTKENISSYIFVNKSGNQFAWFTPQTEKQASYELTYYTDASAAKDAAIANEASAGWKQWIAGDYVGSFMQEINVKKENSGVRQEGEDYFVDWTVTLEVPAERNALENVYLYDVLPSHKNDAEVIFDWLYRLGPSLDYGRIKSDVGGQLEYLDELTHGAFKFTVESEDPNLKQSVENVLNTATTSLGNPLQGLGNDFRLYDSDQTGQLEITGAEGTEYAGKYITATSFGIHLGTLPGTKGKSHGYTIKIEYTTQAAPGLIKELDGRDSGWNTAGLLQKVGNRDVVLAEAGSGYWLDHVKVNHPLQKDIVDYDYDSRILTYRVTIDPQQDMNITMGADYILGDILQGVPGAVYVEDSFELSLIGEMDENYNFKWDPDMSNIIWRSDYQEGDYGVSLRQAETIRKFVSLDVKNLDDGQSEFELALRSADNWSPWFYSAPENVAGKLVTLELTYQVQLPELNGNSGKIANSATLYSQKPNEEKKLLEGVKAEFDYSSALHKKLEITPDAKNGYVAGFIVDVDRTVPQWPADLSTFTVQDDMSKSLTLLADSVEVYGYGAQGGSGTKLTSGYTVSYDDREPDKNTLFVKITDAAYSRYRIRYSGKLDSSVPEANVEMTNTAFVQGTDIKSEEIKKDVYIQKQDGTVVERRYEVKLFKFDASNTSVPLKATFTLYAYDEETKEWDIKKDSLETDENGHLTINNSNESEPILAEKTWYKLVETEVPKGYIPSTTYFRIGQLEQGESKPEEIGSGYTVIPLDQGVHYIPNYKASLKLRKVDSANESRFLTGAKFELYSDETCETSVGMLTEMGNGEYGLDLSELEVGTTYYLKETEAPKGYNLPDTVYEVTFDEKGDVRVRLNEEDMVKNGNCYMIPNESGYELPKTGGSGSVIYIIAGALPIMLGAGFMYRKKCRGRRVQRFS